MVALKLTLRQMRELRLGVLKVPIEVLLHYTRLSMPRTTTMVTATMKTNGGSVM